MSLFNNYKSDLEKILSGEKSIGLSAIYDERNIKPTTIYFSKTNEGQELNQSKKTLFEYDSDILKKYFGVNQLAFNTPKIGPHPDFDYLGEKQMLKHHSISMFVDIKGSTRLSLKHELEKVRLIKDTLLTLCINVVNHFGGHVHRLQGDGALIQFVRKDKNPNDSIINALNASSVLCQVVSDDLSTVFESYGLDPIKIRVGLDYGNDNQVLWSHYGIPYCSELTTTSLHTDLAAKLQQNASENSIRIGKNIVDALDLTEEFISTPTYIENGEAKKDYYIIDNYNQYDFNWKKYLSSFSFFNLNSERKLELKENSRFRIRTVTYDIEDESNQKIYFENNHAIPKGKEIKYELMYDGLIYQKKQFEKIKWEAYNSGKEAREDNMLNHDFEGYFYNKNYCIASAGFLGHHFLKCTIFREHSENVVLKFPIFVNNK